MSTEYLSMANPAITACAVRVCDAITDLGDVCDIATCSDRELLAFATELRVQAKQRLRRSEDVHGILAWAQAKERNGEVQS